jgi:geranylgeranyl reductase family protein
MPDAYDVVIAGAGPAGSSCARRAAERGLGVLVIERASFPRRKPCAAGLSTRSLALLGDEVGRIVHQSCRRVRFVIGRACFVWETPSPVVATTTRRELDALLADAARDAGARLEFGTAVASVVREGGRLTVHAGGRTFVARYVVGADGPRSVVARALTGGPLRLAGAVYVHARPPRDADLAGYEGTITLDLGRFSRGYGWVFPKRDHLNVGVFSQRSLSRAGVHELSAFVRSLGLDAWRLEGPIAAPVPRERRGNVAGRGILLAGDAAGLADPITGEGISHAVASGRAAADAVCEAIEHGGDACDLYEGRVRAEILPEVNALRVVGGFFYAIGPRGVRAAAMVPPVRFALRRLGPWGRIGPEGGTLRAA